MLSPLRVLTRTRLPLRHYGVASNHRTLLTLAIETSCDDTSVAIVEKHKDAVNPPNRKISVSQNVNSPGAFGVSSPGGARPGPRR
ncbi:hypothetical protein KCU89_g14631, partial [Aureobasidium melanogenum]